MDQGDTTPARSGSGSSDRLRAEAPAFAPSQTSSPVGSLPRREGGVKPIRTNSRQRGDVLANLDAIPFTPSQGVCTPSPTNMAAMWVPHPFFQQPQPWGGYSSGSPGPSSGNSDSSLMHSGSQPGTPGGAGSMFGGTAVVWNGFCQPLPYSPTALQIAAASGALGSDPSTPVRGRPGSASAAAAAGMAGPFAMPGSPMVLSPGQLMFSQYFGNDGAAGSSKPRSLSPPESKDSGSGSGDEHEGESDGMSSNGSGSVEVSEAAHHIASAMCAAQQLPGEPPQQLLELASLLHAYGLVSAVPTFQTASAQPGAAPGGAPMSPDGRRQQHRARQKAAPKLNPDGSVRLNARQRRTLRRAQERAMKALLEAQTKAHGISSEQAASNLASMGVASMLLGSPPPAPAPMHSPLGMQMPPAFLAPPAVHLSMSPGPMLAGPPVMQQAHDFGLMQLSLMQQAGGMGGMGFDAASMFGLAGGDAGLSLPLGMHSGMAASMHTPPPRGAGSRVGPGGYGFRGSPGSGGYRGAQGGGRLSRFAGDAVAAF